MQPKVSIIIPFYNVSNYLKQCLDSVQNQTYQNIEVILVNDGSTDNSIEIAQQYTKELTNFFLIQQPNSGLSAARNAGVSIAKGNFVFYLDSDDYLSHDCIEKLVSLQETWKADVAQANFYYNYPDYLLYYNFKTVKSLCINQQKAVEGVVAQKEIKNFAWGKLIRADLAKKHLFPMGLAFEDTLWIYQLLKDVEIYAMTGQPLLYYLQREKSISGGFSINHLDQLFLYSERLDLIQKNETESLFNDALNKFSEILFQHRKLLYQLEKLERQNYLNIINQYISKFQLEKRIRYLEKKQKWRIIERLKNRIFGRSDYVKISKK